MNKFLILGSVLVFLGIQDTVRAELISEKPKTKPVMVDKNGWEWYKDEEGNLFTWDQKFRRPIFKYGNDLVRKDNKEKSYVYGLLCNPSEKEGSGFYGDALSELTHYPAKYKNQFTMYYQDVERLLNIFTSDNCPQKKAGQEMIDFLSKLKTTCDQSCSELAPSYHSGDMFFKDSNIKKHISECTSICNIYIKRQNQKLLEVVLKNQKKGKEITGSVNDSSRNLPKSNQINSSDSETHSSSTMSK